MMGDTAVETECLGDIDREKIVAAIEDEHPSLNHTDATSHDLEGRELDLRLEDEREGARTMDSPGDAADNDNPQSLNCGQEAPLTLEVEARCNSLEQTELAFGGSTSPEISVTDAKESQDPIEGTDLVTITVLEKTEEEKNEGIANGENQIVIVGPEGLPQEAVPSETLVASSDYVSDAILNKDEVSCSSLSKPAGSDVGSEGNRNGGTTDLTGDSSDGPNNEPKDPQAAPNSTHNGSDLSGNAITVAKINTSESPERFLIINNNSSPEETSPNDESVQAENITDPQQSTGEGGVAVDEEAIVPNQMDEDRFKEIEILVAAFDGLEENSSNQSGNETVEVPPETDQPSPQPQGAEVPLATPARKTTSKVVAEPRSEKKVPKAKRTGGAPTRRESASTIEKSEIPNVVGNGKLRVHGFEKLNEQTGLPELVLVNREILERIISDQEKTIVQTKSKLKEMCKICDDLRKVVLAKGLNTVLSPEEANLPVDVVIKMQKLPPHVPTFQTADAGPADKKRRKEHVVVRNSTVAQIAVAETTIPLSDETSGLARDIVNVLPKDIVRALTNGDVLTVQQRQRFIDKITVDIIKAKGVPQPQQIQEIAMQVANMYPRSLVILPEGKRKSSLRKRGRAEDDDEDSVKSNTPKRAKKESLSKSAVESQAGASKTAEVPEAITLQAGASTTSPVVKRGRGRPPKSRTPGLTPDSKSSAKAIPAVTEGAVPNSETGSISTAVANGTPAPVIKRKVGRPRKTVQPEPNPRHVEEEKALSPEEQKKWLQEDVKKPVDQQDAAKQLRLLHNCYDMLYREMAANNYDCAATIAQWPVLRKPEHVLSVFQRLKRVHGRFQEAIRKDAPKLVTFLHERVNTEEGAEWSLQISQAKLSDRYQLPEEVGVMPLLALNFEEDFSLLFKLVPDKQEFDDAIKHVEPVPIIIGVGESIFNCQYHIVVERQLLYSPKTYLDALELVYAAYFVFNLAYPKELLNTFEYVQRYYVGYNPPIKMVTLSHTRPKIALFLKKLKDFERLDWNSNIRANSPGVPSEFERESDPEGEDMDAADTMPVKAEKTETQPQGGDQEGQQTTLKESIGGAQNDLPEPGKEQAMETQNSAPEESIGGAPEGAHPAIVGASVVPAAVTPASAIV